jgi:hypothetical protein
MGGVVAAVWKAFRICVKRAKSKQSNAPETSKPVKLEQDNQMKNKKLGLSSFTWMPETTQQRGTEPTYIQKRGVSTNLLFWSRGRT